MPFGPTSTHKSPPFWPWPFSAGPPTPGGDNPIAYYRADLGVSSVGGFGTNVTAWADQTLNGYDVSQATDNRRPAYDDAVFPSGLPGLLFHHGPFPNDSCLDRLVQLVPAGSPRTVMSLCMPSTAFGGTVCTFQSSVRAFNALWETLSGRQYVYSDDTPGASEPPNALYSSNAPIDDSNVPLVMSWRNQADLSFDVTRNGVAVPIAGTPAILVDNGTPSWRIGSQMDGIADRGWLGWLGAVVVWNKAISDATMALWIATLNTLGGL